MAEGVWTSAGRPGWGRGASAGAGTGPAGVVGGSVGSGGMKVRALEIVGAWEFTPVQHGDARGLFAEWYKEPVFTEAVGHPLHVAQSNVSVSCAGRRSSVWSRRRVILARSLLRKSGK